ncbi:MAG: AAA family ATPase [Solirubrobacteraceae bacterium]
MGNPFVYGEPVSPENLLDREEEARRLVERAVGGHNSRVVAPRRHGKTSLLRRVLRDVGGEGLIGVYVSFFGVLTPGDIAQRIERAYADQLTTGLRAWFAGVRRGLRPAATVHAGLPGVAGAEVSLTAVPGEVGLLDRLALPRRLFEQRGRRTVVVFDEFQDVLSASDRMDAVIRSEIEHHGDAASYIFAGSHVGMMRELFTSKRRAFYGQAGPVDLGPLGDADIAGLLDARFAAGRRTLGGGLDLLLDVARGHSQRTMLLAHYLWERTAPGAVADESAFEAALEYVLGVELRDEFETLWSRLPDTQRRVLAAIADNLSGLYAASTQARVGGGRGGYLKTAATALLDSGELVARAGTATGYEVVDPLLALWVTERRTALG